MRRSNALIVAPARGQNTTTVVTSVRASQRMRQRTRRRRGPGFQTSAASNFLQAYAKTLNDPFEYPGVPLGYDCFLPTTQAAAYYRSSFVLSDAGRDFSIFLTPNVDNFVNFSFALHDNPHSANVYGFPASNATALKSAYSAARIVSGGLRAFALFPQTAASGVMFANSTTDISLQSWLNTTNDDWTNFSGSRISVGSNGACALMRPFDNASFEFRPDTIAGSSSNTLPSVTTPSVSGTGFPANTVIWFEAVVNFECLGRSSGALAAPSDDITPQTNAATFFPTVGQLFSSVQQYLSPPAIMDGIDFGSGLMNRNPIQTTRAGLRLASRFGMGRNTMQSMTPFVQERGRESTVVIEEMKEDAHGPSAGYTYVRRK